MFTREASPTMSTGRGLPSTWRQIATFTPLPAPILFCEDETLGLKPYVEIYPPRERPLWSMHDPSLITRLSNGFSQYLNDRNLLDTPLKPYVCKRFDFNTGPPNDVDQIFLQRILLLVNDLINILHDDFFKIDRTCPDLPILERGGMNITSHFHSEQTPQASVSAFSVRFEDSSVVEHHFKDMLQTRIIPSGTLTDGSAITMKLALQCLTFNGSLQPRFGVVYTGRYVLFSELYLQDDGSIGILLSDFYDLASASCPFIAVMVYLLLPISADRTQRPPEDLLSRIPSVNANSVCANIDKFVTTLPGHYACLQPLQPLHLSFKHPMLSDISRPFYPSQVLPNPSTLSTTPFLSPSSSASSSSSSQDEEMLWTAGTVILRPEVDTPGFSYSISQRPRTVTLNTSLRRPYDYTWRGTAEFFDGTIRPVVAKFAFTDFSRFAREVHIHKVLASQNMDTKKCITPSFYGSYVLSDGALAVMILGDGGTRLPEFDGGWETMSFEHLEQSQVKQMLRKLRALHQAGFEHGDFKPRNVLVDDNGEVHLIDFGHSECHRCSRDCEELKWARERFTELTGVNYKSKTKH